MNNNLRNSSVNCDQVQELKISQSEVDINKLTEHDVDCLSSSGSGSLNEDRDKTESNE